MAVWALAPNGLKSQKPQSVSWPGMSLQAPQMSQPQLMRLRARPRPGIFFIKDSAPSEQSGNAPRQPAALPAVRPSCPSPTPQPQAPLKHLSSGMGFKKSSAQLNAAPIRFSTHGAQEVGCSRTVGGCCTPANNAGPDGGPK